MERAVEPDIPAAPLMRSPTPRTTLATVGVGLLVTVVVFGGTALLLLTVSSLRQWTATLIVTAITVHAVGMIAALWSFLRRDGISLAGIGFGRPTWRLMHLLWQIPAILVAALAALAAQAARFALTGNDPGTDVGGIDAMATRVGPWTAVLLFLAVAVLTPFWEEMLFRGMIQGSLRRRWGRFAGAGISALVFAAAHGVPALLPYTITLGCGLAALREFHGNLWAPLAMHVTVNAVASSALLVALT